MFWLGPTGAASRVRDRWDSTFGATAAVVRVRERAPLAVIGGSIGAVRWTERGGGRIWVDGLVGTGWLGRPIGISIGPVLEIGSLAHPRVGVAAGLWMFAGITPFARLGAVTELGVFGEVGIHVALPVWRAKRQRH